MNDHWIHSPFEEKLSAEFSSGSIAEKTPMIEPIGKCKVESLKVGE